MPAFINNVTGADNAIQGKAVDGIAVLGESKNHEGVRGVSRSEHGAVVGINDSPDPMLAPPERIGRPSAPPTAGGPGGWFESNSGEGVRGWSKNVHHGGVVGVNTGGGVAVYGTSEGDGVAIHGKGGKLAGLFDGNVRVVGNIEHTGEQKHDGNVEITGNLNMTGAGSDIVLTNADCAEDFDVSGAEIIDPGTVMVLGNDGTLSASQHAYDKRVAGVISGAGGYRPAIVLDKQQGANRQPIALMGKVYCKVDAQFGAIDVGDLLTTSPTPGHAMTVSEPTRAFGTVVGKALRPLASGQGLIPILVVLQ